MEARLHMEMLPQPDPEACGPTALHAVYRYYGDDIPLDRVIAEVSMLEGGGTLAPLLACHALRRGYGAVIFTYDLQLFDPTWFLPGRGNISERLESQMKAKADPKLHVASLAYLEYLGLGGELRYEDLTSSLMRKYLVRSMPIITGLSATYLYGSAREFGPSSDYDDLRGEPAGHFVGAALRGRHQPGPLLDPARRPHLRRQPAHPYAPGGAERDRPCPPSSSLTISTTGRSAFPGSSWPRRDRT
jgi:hypothetical protein